MPCGKISHPQNRSPCLQGNMPPVRGCKDKPSSCWRNVVAISFHCTISCILLPKSTKSSPYRIYPLGFSVCSTKRSYSCRVIFAKIWLVRFPMGRPIAAPPPHFSESGASNCQSPAQASGAFPYPADDVAGGGTASHAAHDRRTSRYPHATPIHSCSAAHTVLPGQSLQKALCPSAQTRHRIQTTDRSMP